MPNSNIVPGISNPSKDIVVFRQSERPTVVERTRPAFWYNTSNSGTYFWDTKLDDWVPISASNTTTTTTTAGPLDTCLTEWDITPPLVVPSDYEFVSVVSSPMGGYVVFLKELGTESFYTCFYNKYSTSWGEPNALSNSDSAYGLLNNQPWVFSYPIGYLDCWEINYGLVKNGKKIKTIYENYGAGTKLGFDENGLLYISEWGTVNGNNKFVAVMNDPNQYYVPSFVFNPSTDSILFSVGGNSGYITHMQSGYFTNYELKKYVGDEAYSIKQIGGYPSPMGGFGKILGDTNGLFYKDSKSILANSNFSSSSKTFDWKTFGVDAMTGTYLPSVPINDATTTTYSGIILAANGQYLYQLQVVNGKFVWTSRDIGFDANWEKIIAFGSSDIFLQAKTSDGYIIARSSCVPAVTTTTTTMPPCASDWIPSTSSLNLKASWNQIVAFRSVLYLYHIENQYLYVSESIDGIKWSDRKIAISTPCKSTTIIKVIANLYSVFILGDKNEIFESKNSLGSSFSFYDAGNVYNSTLYRYTRVEVVDIFAGGDFGAFALGKNNRIFLIPQSTSLLYEFAYANYNFTSITSNPYKFSAFIQIDQNAPSDIGDPLHRTGLCDINSGGLLIGPDKSVITDGSFFTTGQLRTINGPDSRGSSAFTSGQWIELPPMDSKIIVYGNGNYVILYKNNTISYSENALNWTTKSIPAGKWNNLLYLNGYFILIGLGKSIYISKTLQENSWQERNIVDSGDWYGVVFSSAGKLFISSVYPDRVMWKVSNCLFESVPNTIPCNTYTTLYQCPFNDCIECVCGGSTGEFATLLECQEFLYSQRSARCPYPSPPAATTTTTSTTTTTTTTAYPTTTTVAPTKNAPDAVSVLFGLPYLSKFDQNTQAPLTDIRLGFTYLGSSSNIETNGTLSITTSDPEFYVGAKNQSYWSKTSQSPNINWIPGYGAYSFSTNDYKDLQLIVYWTGNDPSVFDNNATYSITLTFSVLLADGTTITTTGIVNLKRDASVAYQVISGYSDPVTFNNMLNMGSFTTENLNNPTLIIEADKYTVTTNPINVLVIDKNAIIANNFNIDENYNIYPSSYFELIVGGTWWTVPEATTAPNSFTSGGGIRIPIVNGKGTIPSFTIGLSSMYREGSWRKTLSGENVATGKEYIQEFYTRYNISPSSGSVSANFNTFALPVIVRYTEPMECAAGLISFDGKLTHVPIVNGGFGYKSAPEIRIVGGGGEGAEGTAVVYNGIIRSITITNQGSGYTSRPTVMASNSICPECPPVPFPTCPPGLDCLQTNYNYSGLCPASYSCIPCPTTTTTTTTTNPPIVLTTCDVPASSFYVEFYYPYDNKFYSQPVAPFELNSDGYAPLERVRIKFFHTEPDVSSIWEDHICLSQKVRSDINSITIKPSHPDFIVSNSPLRSGEIKNLSYAMSGLEEISSDLFEFPALYVHWVGTDPSIFIFNPRTNSVDDVSFSITFEIKINSFTDGADVLNSGYIATLTNYV